MFAAIKTRIEKSLPLFLKHVDKVYSLSKISPLIFTSIRDFVLRDGKRIRPILFVTGYLGFSRTSGTPGLYTSALSIELLHDFMLVHDDIIDKADMRRNKPSMHKMLDGYLGRFKKVKFSGQDLAIVIGDIMYATAIHAFLSIRENRQRKENALKKFIEAAIFTGSGEFIELLCGTQAIEQLTKEDVYKIYDYKTAYYTFSCPLAAGAILAGAGAKDVRDLSYYGILLGRAFQIKDDILGMFSEEDKTGKSSLADLKEAKKTLLIWYTYNHTAPKGRRRIQTIFGKDNAGRAELLEMRRLISESGALAYAENEIAGFQKKARTLLFGCGMRPSYTRSLLEYSEKILGL
ncbi:MAG TPA: polyprenyl synthetase family protein [Patescibacteria group bacterium]|nr:polyprenyl synthetase family protein [Patescibacteria group bacterium]